MEPISITLFSLFIITGCGLGWQIFAAREALQAVVDRTMVLSESQGAHAKQTTEAVSALQDKIQSYDALIQALRSTGVSTPKASNRRTAFSAPSSP